MVTAKPVVKNKFWILKDNESKVGTVEKIKGNDYVVTINNKVADFKNIQTLKNHTNIVFEEFVKKKEFKNQVNGYPTDCLPYNGVFNLKERLPLFTKKSKSKSWYAAGYYQITINGKTEIHFCPKHILLKRYKYSGPNKTREFTYL
jgi:hypothetical protein